MNITFAVHENEDLTTGITTERDDTSAGRICWQILWDGHTTIPADAPEEYYLVEESSAQYSSGDDPIYGTQVWLVRDGHVIDGAWIESYTGSPEEACAELHTIVYSRLDSLANLDTSALTVVSNNRHHVVF